MLSWAGYFRGFMAKHGKPVDDGTRLIFSDGWVYSNCDYRGPEVAPPKDDDELRHLQLVYWTLRLEGDVHDKGARARQNEAHEKLRVLHELQRDRSAPLQRYATVESGGRVWYDMRRAPVEIDPLFIEDEIRRLNKEVEECESKIALLSKEMLV